MSTRFTVRPARPDDLERLIALHQVAFPDARGATERTRNFRSNRLGQFEDLRLLCDGDQVLGHAFLFPLECAFGGRWVASAGIASVGVSPHARGGGAARTLLEALHEEAVRRGFAISLLYPFRQAFYASLGYAPVSPYRALSLSPHAIPDAWRRQAAGAVREADGRDRDGIVACYERAALRGTGMVKRTPAAWDADLSSERTLWSVVRGAQQGDVSGYMAWSVSQAEAHAKTTLTVREMVADSSDVRRLLLGFVGGQRDQAHEFEMNVDESDPFDRALFDGDRMRHGRESLEHATGTCATGPMVRILNAERALLARGYRVDGDATVELTDGASAPLHLSVRGGAPRLLSEGGKVRVALDARAFASVAFGALKPSDAARLDWASCEGDADALFSLPPFFSTDPF